MLGLRYAKREGLRKQLVKMKEIYFQRQIGRETIDEIRRVGAKRRPR